VQDITSNLDALQRLLAVLGDLKISKGAVYASAKEDLEKAGVTEAVNTYG
jgi:hypothetical protein